MRKLWHLSAATLRRRFNDVLNVLGIPTKAVGEARIWPLLGQGGHMAPKSHRRQ